MIDITRAIEAVHRVTGDGSTAAGAGRFVRLERDYDAPIDDVWDALTNPERIGRWFLPISGTIAWAGAISSRAMPAVRSSNATARTDSR
jgi:uncharacterized protein YndB with AHSA1/START domain